MKHNFIKTVLMLVTCLVFGTSAAQVIVVNNNGAKDMSVKPNFDIAKYEKRTLANGMEMYQPKREKASSKQFEGADLVTVTCKLVGDESYESAGAMYVYNKDLPLTQFYPDWSSDVYDPRTFVCQLPVDIYDFQTYAVCMKENGLSNGLAYNVKEQVSIQHDTTLIFDFAETQKYEFKYYLPDGTQANLPVVQLREDWSYDTISNGNINSFQGIQQLILKDVGTVASLESTKNVEFLGNDPVGTFFINKLSDRYKIGSVFAFNDNDNACIIKFETSDANEDVSHNSPDNYVIYQEKFIPSLANNYDGKVGFKVITLVDENYGYEIASGAFGKVDHNTNVLYVDAPRSTSDFNKFDAMVAPIYYDQIVCHTDTFGYYDDEGNFIVNFIRERTSEEPIIGLPVLFDSNGNVEYINSGHGVASGDVSLQISNPAVNKNTINVYPGHPEFSYLPNQKLLDYGSSCPINALKNDNIEAGGVTLGKHTRFNCHYIGRYGEVRVVDRSNLETEIKYNDEVICNNYETEGNDMYNFADQGNPDGVITAHFVNRNMMVDGLQGMNVTDVYFDQRQEDWAAPVLQMLLFKDREGNIIDRFETAEEGTFELAGGDFTEMFDEATWITWFDCKPMTVEVSYSPYSADQWLPLEVNEVPSEFFMPGFGYFYRGSLQSVTSSSATGWFDLMVKLTDASGNWQEQVISPAFRIGTGSPTGIEVVTSCDATEVARYTIDGRAISAPQAGVNIVMMSDGTVKKVLVK